MIGLPNRQNVLFDLVQNGQSRQPVAKGQYLTEFDRFAHAGQELEFEHRLHFARDGHEHPLHVVQRFAPLSATLDGAGFSRRVEISELPDETVAEFVVLSGDVTLTADRLVATLAGRGGRVQVALRLPGEAKLTKTAGGAVLNLRGDAAGTAVCELEYRADVAVDQFAPRPAADRSLERAVLDVVPGFEAVRLPVTNQAMPTGLAWRGDGTLVVSSLEGRVWLGHDDDGDGLEDRLVPFSDDLAAPFGVATTGESIDVINKYGLLRLSDDDRDGHADRTELLASGWGHTTDYHDWAIGLPRDSEGNYYISLACQQDARSAVAATWRGSVLKLVPRAPSNDDPRRFEAEPLCGGLRFAQGIALSRSNDLFVTDNQGNYTPFNELNHVVRGARYGFLNRLESDRGLNPPHRSAAVEIPHLWTRSVNGICFLDTPPVVRERLGHELYGPLAGQMVGCEYDTRRLVRMSLERVGGDFQGAVYPLSIEPSAGAETFEGPLVCQVAPNGDLYIGNIRDSGWGAGSNTGSLVRLRWRGELPPGIAEVKVAADGFSMTFTRPVDRGRAAQAGNYAVTSYRRTSTPTYGGPDQDRRVERIEAAEVSTDGQHVSLKLAELREGFVYEYHVRDLGGDGRFFPSEAYYTLRHRLP